MGSKTLHTNQITFMDLTDDRKLDVYITSNLPITQIKDTNAGTYTPDWSSTNLVLGADIYLDSVDVTDNENTIIKWYEQIGTGARTQIGTSTSITIDTNKMTSIAMVTYSCEATYQNVTARSQITFTRVDTGRNGTDGLSAPAVQAQYSVDGEINWTSTLNATTHKYIRYSYDGGNTWTTKIKMVGDDGTSVNIKGTATSKTLVDGSASYYTLVYNSVTITGASLGDAYLLDGHLYVCVDSRDGNDYFMDVGQIQGPQGNDGQSSYVFIRYATDASGANMSLTPSSTTTHIGICTVNTNNAPTEPKSYTWSKFVGDSAKSIILSGDSQVFKVSKANVYTPATIKVMAQAFNTSATTTWTYSTNGGQTFVSTVPAGVSRNGNIVTITGSALTTNSIVVKASDGVVEDVFTIYKAFDGTDGSKGEDGQSASMAFLTNENVTFGANASGQITETSITTSVVAYNGTTKVTPELRTNTDGTLAISDLPTGMTAVMGTVVNKEVPIIITVANSETLGSALSNNGSITIPVTSPVNTNLILSWSKVNSGATGPKGVGVKSTTVSYGVSNSASTKPADDTWQSTIPTVAEGEYLWTRTIIDYTDDSIDDTVTYTYAKQGTTGSSGTSVTVSSIQYQAGTSATAAPTGIWSDNVVTVAEGSYLWTKTIFSDGKIAYGVAKQGAKGSAGTPASLVNITPSALYFKSTTGKDGTFTPDYIYLYPRFQTVTFSKWEYSRDGGATWIAVSGANGISIGTYNSIANTLRLARTSTLYTDTVTSISFRCVSSNASVYDTVSIAKIYDVVDLQIGGRNYIKNSAPEITKEVGVAQAEYLSLPYDLTPLIEEHGVDQTYTLSFDLKSKNITNNNRISVYPEPGTTPPHKYAFPNTTFVVTQEYQRFSITFKPTRSSNANATLTRISVYGTYDTGNIPVIKNLKLELGNKATDWSPAPEDLNNITFQIYAPDGYLLTNDLQSLTLQTFAYEGSLEIVSGATFQWSHLIDDVWTNISGATGAELTVTKSDVLKAKSYRCIMTYKSKTYTSTITVQDKTDTYNSIMCISSNTKGSECYWVLYTLVYSDTSEIDPLLGPISISAPVSPVNGDYWYAVDSVNATVQLKEYNGTTWKNSTDKQSLTYLWNIVNDGSVKTPIGGDSKVQVVSCHDFTATATLMCDVSNESDGTLTQSSLSITDASDPIVSQTEPTNAVDGQIWIKPNTNGAYNMFVWSEAAQTWIASDMDTRNKVYTSKPSSYSKGDIWITESNTVHSKYLEGTLLQASQDNTVYNENDWSSTLKYDKDIAKINSTLYDLSQYVTITSSGLKIGAVNSDKELSPFTSLFTSTELAFYQNSDKLLTLANNQLTAPRIVVEEELEVNKKISLGDLQITIESNGSFSFAVTK